VLRTAMLSTRADRYYGPPDGIQPEFDLLSRHNRCRNRAANCIGHFTPQLKPKSGIAAGRRTIHHNSSSRKTSVTLFYRMISRYTGKQTVCRLAVDSTWQSACRSVLLSLRERKKHLPERDAYTCYLAEGIALA
jgi:hypothetical protein